MFAFQYPAPGVPAIAQEVAEALKPVWCGLDHDQWGLDHGAWSVLAHFRPGADIPAIQLSINALKPLAYHLDVGTRLAALRQRGIMVIGSGNVVHNLALLQRNKTDSAFDWAQRFDEAVADQLQADPSSILKPIEHPDYSLAVPTPEHFIPLLYVAGIAAASGVPMIPLVRGYSMGSLSMTCYGVGVPDADPVDADGAAGIPAQVPADQSNI